MTSYNSTARRPFSKGGKVDKKPPKPKRIILWKGKAKDWPGAQKAKERTGNEHGGKINIKKVGSRKAYGEMLKNRKQGYKDREDESLGMRTGKESGKKQSMRDRRDESYGAWGKRPNQRINRAKGGKADKNWIQGVNKSIKKRGTKGVCTGKKFGSASCPPGSKRYNLAKTFKKMARAKHASGGLVRFI